MKILLTGNQGYIGCVMEEVLLNAGHDVVGFDTGFFEGKTFVPLPMNVKKNRRNNQIKKDIRDATKEDIEGYDTIIHLAALSNDPLGNLNPQLTEEINFKATLQLAKCAKECGVNRFIFSSSCSMYGASDTKKFADENSPFLPQSVYATAKVQSEAALNAIADNNFSPVYMRNATVFGISPKMRFDLVLNNLCGWAWTTKEVVMLSDGKPWRPLVHVRDLCKAFLIVAETPREKIHNRAFNVGRTDENFTIRELAEKVVAGIPSTKLKCLNQNSGDTRSYRASFERIKELGFAPDWNVDKGITELFKTYKYAQLTTTTFEDDFFVTLKRMKSLLEEKKIDKDLRWR